MAAIAALGLAALAALGLALRAAPAFGAFPGQNGKIAFTSQRDGNLEIYAMDADGQNQTRLTNTTSAFRDQEPAFSPDGSEIAFRNLFINPTPPRRATPRST